ncbi:hypothetical protein Poly30_52160 [Planctomycetes bacterium Poly30]|uniref:Uncharacterized protein n=1 Tax=Saltatorellus ferox TaxID=2528018 RepID=A0A518EZY8_9BACT|nr:hypothetical protein Poly30_52160 [Planctomycetes bacterium Poly30]
MRFRFQLLPPEKIEPWGEPPRQTLSWFALTDGFFSIDTDAGALCCYSPAVVERFGSENPGLEYQVAAMARDVLDAIPGALAPLPTALEDLMAEWPQFSERLFSTEGRTADPDDHYTATRWLGERSPGFLYFNVNPQVFFVRIQDDIQISWDCRGRSIDGAQAFADPLVGSFLVPVPAFIEEARRFADELLGAMENLINDLESGARSAQIKVSAKDLRSQHKEWVKEFSAPFVTPHEPDIEWDQVLAALGRVLAR